MSARIAPRWERVQRAKGAAAYASYSSVHAFLVAVAEGVMPAPFDHGGADAWDIVEIDAAIDAIKAGAGRIRNWREAADAQSQARGVARGRG